MVASPTDSSESENDLGAVLNTLGPAIVRANNAVVDRATRGLTNPRAIDDTDWHARLSAHWPTIRAEWDAFVRSGARLPIIDDVVGDEVEYEGPWRAGVLCSMQQETDLARRWFPETTTAVQAIPRLQAAIFSWFSPKTILHTHQGPNAGVLRYHIGVDCPEDSALEIEGRAFRYQDGIGILFNDRSLHRAWNNADRPRVTLFCEIESDAPGIAGALNHQVQRFLHLHPARQQIIANANAWEFALNRHLWREN